MCKKEAMEIVPECSIMLKKIQNFKNLPENLVMFIAEISLMIVHSEVHFEELIDYLPSKCCI